MATKSNEELFNNLDSTLNETLDIRNSLITKLFDAVKDYNFKVSDKNTEANESFMKVIDSLDGLLKGKEKSALDNVKIHLTQQSTDATENISKSITTLLRMINLNSVNNGNGNNINPDEISNHIDEEFSKTGLNISTGELEPIEGSV
jgi:hypothetical protein